MKQSFILSICYLIFMNVDCYREGKNCHPAIIIKNNSNDTVIFALTAYYDKLCNLGKVEELPPGKETELRLKSCWENELSNGKTQELFIVDPIIFNKESEYYSCDSLKYKNKILKHYVLSLDDLKKNNFTVTYP